ncbi:hypothetical protein ACTFIY_008658 [Dictyostelium cf. discoideum]
MDNESPNSLVVTKLKCTNQVELFTLYDNKTIEVNLEKATDGYYYFDILNYPYKTKLYDLSSTIYFMPEISLFPKIPTTGENSKFIPIYNSTLDLFDFLIPKGCGILNFYYDYQQIEFKKFFNTTYEKGAISGTPLLDGEGSLIFKGSNLFNTSIEIVSRNDTEANPTHVGTINDAHTEVKFSINEARYHGNWKINVKICNTFHSTYTFLISPELIRMEGVLTDNGGNITFTGNYLGYNQNIDGKYTSNTIKISYDLPLIQNVQQRGNSQICNVTGVYLSKVIGMTVITGMNMKTNITKMNSTSTSEELDFILKPGFMELIINDGAESFRAPRFNFKITPTITDGQSFQSDTPGDDLKIKGIFMRTVDFDGRDIPLTFKSESGGPMCIHSKDGDGLSFTCVLKSGFGSNHMVNIYYNLLQIGTFNVSYNPPQLTGVYQEKNGNIKINGYNLGDSIKDSIITVVFSDSSTLNGTIIASGMSNKKTASYIFQLGDQQGNMLEQYTLKPIIGNSDPAVPCGGGMVTINGHYFFNYAKDTTTITIGKVLNSISVSLLMVNTLLLKFSNLNKKKQRRAFRYLDNLRLKVRAKHASQISKHYTFGDQRAPKGPKSPHYDFLKKLSRLPLIRRYFKEHND